MSSSDLDGAEKLLSPAARSVAADVVHRSEEVHETRALCAGSSSNRCVVGLRQSRDVLAIEAGE